MRRAGVPGRASGKSEAAVLELGLDVKPTRRTILFGRHRHERYGERWGYDERQAS